MASTPQNVTVNVLTSTRYEYSEVSIPRSVFVEQLNTYAAAGWRVVQATQPSAGQYRVVLLERELIQ